MGEGARKAERLTESATPNHLIRTMPAKGDRPMGRTGEGTPAIGLVTTVVTAPGATRPSVRCPFGPVVVGAPDGSGGPPL